MMTSCSPEQRAKQLGSDRSKLMTWPAYELMTEMYERLIVVWFFRARAE
jgi:hypothetical protein